MQPALHTHTKSRERSRAQIHKGTCCQIIHNTADAISPFFGGTMLSVGRIHGLDWSLLVLWQRRGWLSDRVYVTGYLGRVTWDCFAWPGHRQHILLFQEHNKPRPCVEAMPGPRSGARVSAEGGISLSANCIQADMWLQPVSRMQPGWLALSAQHIRGNWPYLMWHGWHCLESCEESLPMINSSSENTMRFSSPCLPLQMSVLNPGCLPSTTEGRAIRLTHQL